MSRKVIGAAAATALAAAAPLAVPKVQQWEGRSNVPYLDLAKKWTVCDGETNVTMRAYSDAECDAMTRRAIYDVYGPKVIECAPGLVERVPTLAASIVLSYNIGTAAFCRSTIARRFNAGDWRGGCEGFPAWSYVGKQFVQGLRNRRLDEMALCYRGAA